MRNISELNKLHYAVMRGAKYSVVLGGHYSVHAVFKCATNSANTTILGHIRITNTETWILLMNTRVTS